MSTISFEAPRGMRDFYPEDMVWRNRIFDAWRDAAEHFGFQNYDACVVESLELLQRKSGEEVSEQIYAFEDKSGRKLALRPEMTPTLARMVAAKQKRLPFPIKWYTMAQCFRYERMTRGRKREHDQWNMDIIGSQEVLCEAEILGAAVYAMRAMGMPDEAWRIHVSSRALLGELLAVSGIAEAQHPAVFIALDKRGKISDEEIAALLCSEGLDDGAIEKTFRLLNVTSLEEATALAGENSPAIQNLKALFTIAESMGYAHLLMFDIAVIRGLSYYTGIVFEAFDAQRKFRAIFGGGRYDSLLALVGGQPTPAVGMGFGDVVVGEVLREILGEDAPIAREGYCIGYMTAAERSAAVCLATRLRTEKNRVDLSLVAQKPKHFFGKAGNSNARFAIFLGPDDVASGKVQVKDLQTRESQEINL
ncbi:MAG: histidine--tRNA ligase [Kiritimatiellae bacterium]|nr:histidine--tRNA ligase [Kiritimatiellia bacterium]